MFFIKIVLVWLIIICIIFCLIGPFWFKYRLIPKIEHRLGKKIVYSQAIRKISPIKFGSNASELASYITNAWLGAKKLKKDASQALNRINYNIKDASKEEIIISILYTASLWIGFIGMLVLYFISKITH